MTVGIGKRRKDPPVESPLTTFRRAQEPVVPVRTEEPLGVDELLGDAVRATGPAQPTGWHGPEAPQGLPRVFAAATDHVQVVGLHGGAGVSTVSRLLGGQHATDAGVKVPMGGRHVVLLVARTHAAGLAAVRRAGQAWAAHLLDDVELLGLVLVDDGPRMSREQQRQVKGLLAVFPATWRVGWHEPWRVVTDPATDELPARIRRTVTEIRDRGISRITPTSGLTKEKK